MTSPKRGRIGTTTCFALALMAMSPPAHAAAEKGKGEAEQHVDLAGVPFPIVVDGRLTNYVFVVLRLTPQPGADATKIKAREPFLRDYLVRLGHKQPFVRPGDATRVDEARLLAAAAEAMPRLIGPKLVRTVGIASQTPQRRSGLSTLPPIRPIVP